LGSNYKYVEWDENNIWKVEEKINKELERCKRRDLDVSNAEIIDKRLNVKPIYRRKSENHKNLTRINRAQRKIEK